MVAEASRNIASMWSHLFMKATTPFMFFLLSGGADALYLRPHGDNERSIVSDSMVSIHEQKERHLETASMVTSCDENSCLNVCDKFGYRCKIPAFLSDEEVVCSCFLAGFECELPLAPIGPHITNEGDSCTSICTSYNFSCVKDQCDCNEAEEKMCKVPMKRRNRNSFGNDETCNSQCDADNGLCIQSKKTGEYYCVCDGVDWEGDGIDCTETLKSQTQDNSFTDENCNDSCHEMEECIGNPWNGYRCECIPSHGRNNDSSGTCEVKLPNKNCGWDEESGLFKCSCLDPWSWSEDHRRCFLDRCVDDLEDQCPENSSCSDDVDDWFGYKCRCEFNYFEFERDFHGATVCGIRACETDVSLQENHCTNAECVDVYDHTGELNEWTEYKCDCNGNLVPDPSDRHRTCICPDGYDPVYEGGSIVNCVDADECDEDVVEEFCATALGTCVNTEGSYDCFCNPNEAIPIGDGDGNDVCICEEGYLFVIDQVAGTKTCKDINECNGDPNPCWPGDCSNDEGGYTCSCVESNIDGLLAVEGACVCPKDNYVVNHNGDGCICPDGFMESDGSCDDIDECATEETNTCGSRGTCHNTLGSYECECKTGVFAVLSEDKKSCPCGPYHNEGYDGNCYSKKECEDGNLCEPGLCLDILYGYRCYGCPERLVLDSRQASCICDEASGYTAVYDEVTGNIIGCAHEDDCSEDGFYPTLFDQDFNPVENGCATLPPTPVPTPAPTPNPTSADKIYKGEPCSLSIWCFDFGIDPCPEYSACYRSSEDCGEYCYPLKNHLWRCTDEEKYFYCA